MDGRRSPESFSPAETSETPPVEVLGGGEFREPTNPRIWQINQGPTARLRAVEAIMYSFELAERVMPRGELKYLAGRLEKPQSLNESGEYNELLEHQEELDEATFTEEESRYNSLYDRVLAVVSVALELHTAERHELHQRTDDYTPRKVLVLRELRALAKPHKNTKTGELISEKVEGNAIWVAEDALRLLIDEAAHEEKVSQAA